MTTPPSAGPCEPWATWEQVTGCSPVDLADVDVDVQALTLEMATAMLYDLTRQRYPGICEVTRVVCPPCRCGSLRNCCCGPRHVIDLGSEYPVTEVSEVVIDGVALDPADYRVDDWRWLVKLSTGPWPTGMKPETNGDTYRIEVTWSFGVEPPAGAQRAAALYAAYIAMTCDPAACRTPDGAVTLVREGVTYQLKDPAEALKDGKTGIYLVDFWVAVTNGAMQAAPAFVDPAARRRVHAVDTG